MPTKLSFEVICKNCESIFLSKQSNSNQLPKLCPKCNNYGSMCVICSTKIPFGRKVCGKQCDSKLKSKRNYNIYKSGNSSKMGYQRGKDNIACRPEIKKKIYEGLKKSMNKYKQDTKGNVYRSNLEVKVANYLIEHGISFVYENILRIGNTYSLPDFTINNKVIIEVAGFLKGGEEKYFQRYVDKLTLYLTKTNYYLVVVTYTRWSGRFNFLRKKYFGRLDIVCIDEDKLVELELKGITNVDYSHFLPDYAGKCNQFHSHTSYTVDSTIIGYPIKGMVVDFKVLKNTVKDVVNLIDHKLVVGLGSIEGRRKKLIVTNQYVEIFYESLVGKKHYFKLPKEEVFVLEDYATLENILLELCKRALNSLPGNVFGIELMMREGVDNGCRVQFFRDNIGNDFSQLDRIINYQLGNSGL